MKKQILSRQNAPLNIIGFLLLVTTTTIGCGVLFNFSRVMRLDPVILTQDDLPTMRLKENRRLDRFPNEHEVPKKLDAFGKRFHPDTCYHTTHPSFFKPAYKILSLSVFRVPSDR